KLITQDQLAQATLQQSREGGRRKLGEILVESGILPQRRFEQLLAAQRELLAKRQATEDATPAAPPEPEVERVPSLSDPAAPGFHRLDAVLEHAVRRLGASDFHLHSGAPLRVRRHGRMTDLDANPVDRDTAQAVIQEILNPEQQAVLDEHGQVDLAYTVAGVSRFRGNIYRQQRGWDAVFRAIPPQPPSLSDLGMPTSLARFANFHQGLVLITGPAGCGKSSTLAAMINIVNEDRRDHIITIEDPIEVLHPSKRCVVNQRQVGPHTRSFARALRAALREDPDVIAIGELRDLETISLALTAAETGHLVLATLHTNNAIRTINRILGVFPPSQQDQIRTMVSESLRAIVSQRLIPRADGNGRVAALEILIANKAVGNLVRENKTFQIKSVLQTGGTQGMCLLDSSLADLVKSGAITREEAAKNAEDPARFLGAAASPAPAAATA
ncbi:MAG TPA: type IV pilus twitching motility protein PilT, partial [Thermoanaerobaculia bacterium]|nr:type IV pilus twitching motility protein PilT [Thermoanaerobaculia bacterium]